MLDRKGYEEKLQKAREEQINEIAEYLSVYLRKNAAIREMPVWSPMDEEIEKKISSIPIPRHGRAPREVADELVENVFERAMLIQHPKFFSFVTSGVSPYSLAGAVLSDIYNLNLAGYEISPGAAIIEEKLIKWMGSRAGFPDTCGGLFTSGGSLSNLTGCIAARNSILAEEEYAVATAYLSDQAHSSVRKGLKLMGLRKDQINIIPSDDNFAIRMDLLEQAIEADIAAGKRPFLLIGTVGTTNTGSIDPMRELAALRDRYGMWMHIDGAFGGSILFSDIYKHLASGIELADSLSWDLHKWAMQGYSCSALIARDKNNLITTYAEHPEYLEDIINTEHNDGWDLGIEMSRPARCLKLWFTVQAMGTDLLSDVIDYAFFNANVARRELESRENWQLTSEPCCGTLTFRYAPASIDSSRYDELNAEISRRIIEEGKAYIVTTMIKNMRVLRLCLINGNTNDDDVRSAVAELDEIARRIEREWLSQNI